MIKAVVGRVVWYYPPALIRGDQPWAALVCYVWSDRCVNLSTFDANGVQQPRTNVPLLQDDDPAPTDGHYASYMPYQIGQ